MKVYFLLSKQKHECPFKKFYKTQSITHFKKKKKNSKIRLKKKLSEKRFAIATFSVPFLNALKRLFRFDTITDALVATLAWKKSTKRWEFDLSLDYHSLSWWGFNLEVYRIIIIMWYIKFLNIPLFSERFDRLHRCKCKL